MGAFTQTILSNGTITASGSSTVYANFGNNETSLVINITGPITGSSPTITFTIQEIDPGNQSTTLGASKTGSTITGVATQIITIPNLTTGSIIISWVVTGSSPSFGGIYATLVDKPDTPYIYDLNGNGPATVKPASTAPITTDPALVVVLSPNQQAIPVTTAGNNATTGVGFGRVQYGGAASILTAIRATAYIEQTTNFTGSVRSSSANDTSAGTGARTVTITYFDQTGAGPFTETVTLNGTTAVNLVNTNHCYIEKMTVITVGSTGSNAGTISLFTGAGATGTTVGSIGFGTNTATIGDNETLWAHHYVSSGKTASLYTLIGGTTGNQTAFMFLKVETPLTANSPENQVSDFIVTALNTSSVSRLLANAIKVAGFSRITMYVISNGTNTAFFGAFDYSEV